MKFKTIPYKEEYGPVKMPEGFLQQLEGKTTDEQAECFVWVEEGFGTGLEPEVLLERCKKFKLEYKNYVLPLDEHDTLIVKDGIVVGAALTYHTRDGIILEPIMLYGNYCYDITSDNNGAGYKETRWYKYLQCLPAGHGLWG